MAVKPHPYMNLERTCSGAEEAVRKNKKNKNKIKF